MKKIQIAILILTCSITLNAQEKHTIPVLPEIINEFPNVRDFTKNQQQNECYFSVQSFMGELSALVVVTKKDGTWLAPKIASFSGKYHDLEPFLAPDGLHLYFVSNRPLDSTQQKPKDYDIWFVKRASLNSDWSSPINIGAPINTNGNEFYPAITNSGNIYFTSDGAGSKGKDDIFISQFENGNYTTPRSLDENINSEGYEFNAYVSPDENTIIYTCYNRKDGLGSGDLYSSNKENGKWTAAKNMGANINSDKMDYCPFVLDNTLFFTSKRNSLNGVLVKKLALPALLKKMRQSENGLSRIYKTKI